VGRTIVFLDRWIETESYKERLLAMVIWAGGGVERVHTRWARHVEVWCVAWGCSKSSFQRSSLDELRPIGWVWLGDHVLLLALVALVA